MNAEEFGVGIKEVEAARGKTYGDEHHDLLRAIFDELERLTARSWMDICDVLRKQPRHWLPVLGEFIEVRRQLPNLEYIRDGSRSVCSDCHQGVRFWLMKTTGIGDSPISYTVARCRCLAGDRWTPFPTMDHVEKRGDFAGWVGAEVPEEAVKRETLKLLKVAG